MSTATLSRDSFAPQRPPGMRKGLLLALAAHALLILALAWSVNWKASEPEGVVAELWSALPQTAAPRAAPPPMPTPPVVEPKPPVVEPTPPVVQAKPPPPKPEPQAAPRPDPQIAIEREARRKAELARREEAKQAEAERQREREKEVQRQRQAEAAEKKKLEEKAKQDEARTAAIRESNLRRMMKEAGTSDDPAAAGTAARTAGPSAGYAGRIRARIKPHIVLTGSVSGNPTASVEVRCAPDGTIVSRRILKSSGSPVWDETVLRAIDKTEVLPRDTDGRVPSPMTIDFRPQE